MHRRVEPPAVRAHAEQLDDAVVERFLFLSRKVAVHERLIHVVVAELDDQRGELGLQLVEDLSYFGRRGLRLEVVEQDVVRLVDVVEALDVAETELDVALEDRQERLEVRVGLRFDPDRPRFSRGASHLCAELGRHAKRLVVVAADDPNEACVVGVGIERLRLAGRFVEQPPRLVSNEELVREELERPHLLGPVTGAGRGHHRLLIPAEDPHDPLQVCDRSKPILQRLERAHGGEA